MTKKIFGYIAIVIAALLILALLSQLGKLFSLFNAGSAVEFGYLIGFLASFGIQLLLVIALIRYGIKWVRREKDDEDYKGY